MQIEPVAKQYKEISKANFLQIPPFQRPYSWTPDNIEEFWSDLIGSEGEEYFLGSVVFYRDKKDKSSLFITDGQQRLTTINIVLAAIRNLADRLGFEDLAEGTHGFIENIDEDNKKRFAIKYSVRNNYFAECILNREPTDAQPSTQEERNQRDAFDYFKKRIESHLESVAGTAWPSSSRTEKILRTIRNSILNMRFVVLTLDSEDEAFVIFETLNTRGKDLEVSDLVKNHFAKNIKDKNKDIDTVSKLWGNIREEFESTSSKIDFDTFLVHYWLSQEKYVSKKKLFGEFKKSVPKSKALNRLKDLVSAAKTYRAIVSPDQDTWSKNEEAQVFQSLSAISDFSVAQARPLLLSICRKYRDEELITLKAFQNAISLVENFTFQFNAITQSRGGGGIAGMYASLAQSVHAADGPQDFANVCKEIRTRFKNRDLGKFEFKLGFSELLYHNRYTRDRATVRYVLKRFRQHYAPTAADDFSKFSIEHLISQSQAKTVDDWRLVGSIGNLIFVPAKLNEKLGTKPAYEKLKILKSEGYADPTLATFTQFDWEDITDRLDQMTDLAFDSIWKV